MTDPLYNATVDLLERNAAPERAARPYLRSESQVLTYAEVIAAAQGIAGGLLARGLVPGDRILILCQDSPELVATFWGTIRVGLVPVPLNPAISSSDLAFILEDSGAKAVLFDSTAERIVAAAAPGAALLIATHDSAIAGAQRWQDVRHKGGALPAPATRARDTAFWLYTSGTTGTAKAAVHTHGGLRAAATILDADVMAVAPTDIVLSVSKMFFAFGLGNAVYVPAAAGASSVVSDFPASPAGVQGLIDRHAPTLLFGVASFFAGYCKLEEAKLGTVRMVLSAGEVLPAALFEAWKARFGAPLLDGFGCTEALYHVLCNRLDDAAPGSAGRLLTGYELEVRDAAGKRLPAGKSGELWLRGPTVFQGYWNRPDLNKRMLVDGWLRTGDVVSVREGRVFHEGRVDDLMKLGGVWVTPAEIEAVLRAHADVEEAAVVIVHNEASIPVLKAFIRSQRADEGLHRELAQACRAKLASFKVPRFFETVAELPRTASGKLKRFELRSSGADAPPPAEAGMMLVIFQPGVAAQSTEVEHLRQLVARHKDVTAQVYSHGITEVYLSGATAGLSRTQLEAIPGVKRVVTLSEKFRVLSPRGDAGFTYNGVRFDQSTFHLFAGLCAVDTRDHVDRTMRALKEVGLVTTRMGAYKPRTSPYDFQGLERECLPFVFELAGKHGIRVIAMEVLHERHLDEIRDALRQTGNPTGVLLQIGTRNAQNFELLKYVGQQTEFPVLYKRGMGVTLDESLNACEYIASSGNPNVIFCLRGVKSHLGDPHRNFVDFSHVSVVKRLTRMPVCIDPSHSVGKRDRGEDGILDIFHVTAQGLITGANMVLVDLHPAPELAVCDGPQALLVEELPLLLDDIRIVREAYARRVERLRPRPS